MPTGGLKVLTALFRERNKIYQKGWYTHKFLDKLDFKKIITSLDEVFDDLEKALNIKNF